MPDGDDKSIILPELLAPCGSPEALDAALLAGADAVYLGGRVLNARMNAKNFGNDILPDAVKKAHAAGVKVYVTMNTLVTDRAMREAMEQASFLYGIGVDALIVADLGFASMLRRYLPGMPIHASTQVSGHDLEAARFLAEAGFSRMVCARELTRENIEYLVRNSPIPIEMFIHGAMCVSASGQCLMSSFIGGRSGNCGECAQPCRMQYNGSYPLSLKDMCLAGHITEIISSGVASLKIEGRMKSPEYVYTVVSVYRRLLDEQRSANANEMKLLEAAFSRGGFTDGYYTGDLRGMNGVRSESDKRNTDKLRVDFRPVKRETHPINLTDERETPALPESFNEKGEKIKFKPVRSARWYRPETMCGGDFFEINYIPLDSFEKYSANGVLMPPVIPDSERKEVRKKLIAAREKGALHALVGNIGHIELAKECGFIIHGDYRLNLFSNASARIFDGFEDLLLSPELILPQLRDINAKKGIIVYGRIPLMTLERSCGARTLVDRTKAGFPVIKEGGREIVFNSVPTYMADQRDKLKAAGPFSEHFIFTVESRTEAEQIINGYKKCQPPGRPVKRIR